MKLLITHLQERIQYLEGFETKSSQLEQQYRTLRQDYLVAQAAADYYKRMVCLLFLNLGLIVNLYSMKSLWRMTTRSSKSSTTKRWRSEKSTRTPSADWRTPWSVSNWPKPQPLTIMKLYKPATIICVRTWTRTKRPVWPDLAPLQVLSIEYHSPLEDSVRRYEAESSLFHQFLHRYSWTRQWV